MLRADMRAAGGQLAPLAGLPCLEGGRAFTGPSGRPAKGVIRDPTTFLDTGAAKGNCC